MTLTINATVKSIEPSADGLNDVISLEAHVDDSWETSFKNSFNETSTYPVRGINANTEGSVTFAAIQITVTAQEASEIALAVGDHLSFTSHFQRNNVAMSAPVVEVDSVNQEVAGSEAETSTEEVASREETASSDTEEKLTEEVATDKSPASTEETETPPAE